MSDLNVERRLAEAHKFLEKARQFPPPPGPIAKGDYEITTIRRPKGVRHDRWQRTARHNLAHKAVELLIGPLRYSEFVGVLTDEQRHEYELALQEAVGLRGY